MKSFKEYILNEGGAAGHMAHPFDLESVKNGNDLVNFFNNAVSSVKKNIPSLKIDGINASFRLVDTPEGKKFALDRGSMKPLDVQGITIDKLVDRFGEGHGMVNAGNKLLGIMNTAYNDIYPELKQLGFINNKDRFFNTEFVEGKTNVLNYDNDFLAIHGINDFYQVTPRRRASKEIDYDQKTLDSLIEKLNKYAKKYNFIVYGSVPAKLTKIPNFGKVLNDNFKIIINGEVTEKPLINFLRNAKNPFDEKITLIEGKKVGALSKYVYQKILNNTPLDEFIEDEKDYQKAIDGAVLYHATRLLGDEFLKSMTSDMGDVKYHEGIVIRDKKFNSKPVKITGEFILGGQESKFRSEQESEIYPYYGNYITNPPVFNTGEGMRLRKTVSTFGEMYDMLNEFESVNNFKTVVIYPGRFHPFHKGHASVYNKLKQLFPYADIFISTSDKSEPINSPFSFDEKLVMIQNSGIDPNFVEKTANPYLAKEIVDRYNPDETKLVFAISQKDMEGDKPRFKFGLKKDGTPSYFQPFESIGESEYASKHGYITTLPTMNFKILDKDIRNASEIRELYKNSDEKTRNNLIQDLYGSLNLEVKRIFDNKLI
jgi:cytidyltransferase-like protein